MHKRNPPKKCETIALKKLNGLKDDDEEGDCKSDDNTDDEEKKPKKAKTVGEGETAMQYWLLPDPPSVLRGSLLRIVGECETVMKSTHFDDTQMNIACCAQHY